MTIPMVLGIAMAYSLKNVISKMTFAEQERNLYTRVKHQHCKVHTKRSGGL